MSHRDTDQPRVDRDLLDQLVRENGLTPDYNGYRGDVGRGGVAQDTIGDNGLEIRARVRRYQLILWRCAAGFVPKSAISEISRSGQRKNGRSGGRKKTAARCAWAVLGGIPSGWGQFGAVNKLLSFIGGLRRQLNAL